jgi:hypothetical protein
MTTEESLWYRRACSERFLGDKNPSKRSEVRKKIGDSRRGKKFPKLSEAKRGKPGTMQGKKHSAEAILKMKQPRKRTKCPICNLDISIGHLPVHIRKRHSQL